MSRIIDCTFCNGGKSYREHNWMFPCPVCNGLDKIEIDDDTVDDDKDDMSTVEIVCIVCFRKGNEARPDCKYCNGEGTIIVQGRLI